MCTYVQCTQCVHNIDLDISRFVIDNTLPVIVSVAALVKQLLFRIVGTM